MLCCAVLCSCLSLLLSPTHTHTPTPCTEYFYTKVQHLNWMLESVAADLRQPNHSDADSQAAVDKAHQRTLWLWMHAVVCVRFAAVDGRWLSLERKVG